MHLTNFHTHTNFCDGRNTAEEMIYAAISCGIKTLGFSTHGPTPFPSDWNIKAEDVERYIEEIKFLKKKYEDMIEIFLGMELDYIPGIGFNEKCLELISMLDYYIGSVHYLGTFRSGAMWTVDYDLRELKQGIDESFGGDARLAVETYYELISEMASRYQPPIIGHLDLFKKNNKNNQIFDENEQWYIDTVAKCLDKIKETSSAVEINTGGISRGYTEEQYPSDFILRMVNDRNIPILINSDAHDMNGIACKFREMYRLANDIGFTETAYLTKDGWKLKPLNYL
jgi:histidinol-phosphatase (PHP family)